MNKEELEEEYKRQIEEWKNEFNGSVYASEIIDTTYIWRGLSRAEFKKANEYFEDDYDKAEYVVRTCVLYPEIEDWSIGIGAGIPETLTSQILEASGFTLTSKEFDRKIQEYEKDMATFDNQISCIIKEAFPEITIQEIEDWQMEKTLWYYARAKWMLENLRGVVLEKDEQIPGMP